MSHYCDTHCHLYMDAYASDLQQVIEDAWNQNVKTIVVPGIDLQTSRQAIELAEKYEPLYAAIGVHPHDAQNWKPNWHSELLSMAKHPKVVAIGEIGLDYYRNYSPRDIQQQVLQDQMVIALETGKPVIFHERDSAQDLWKFIDTMASDFKETFNRPWGVLHSFSSSLEYAYLAMETQLFMGISGPVTYKNALNKQNNVRELPLSAMVLETDGPYLPPHPYRGKRNVPQYIPIIAEKIAQLKACTLEEVRDITTDNANSLFFWRSNC